MDVVDEAVEWIVACVVPEAVAPHPNFTTQEIRPAGLLGLLAECRFAEYGRHAPPAKHVGDDGLRMVDAARHSLEIGEQSRGVQQLRRLCASRPHAPFVAAAALFACNALGELDQPATAVRLLRSTLEGQVESTDTDPAVLAALHQQLVLRLVEAGRQDEAAESAGAVLLLLNESSGHAPLFPTSKGYSGGSRRAYSDLRSTLRSHASAALATFEGFAGRRWISIVKSRPAPPDERQARNIAEAGTALARREFERRYSWNRQRRVFASGDPVMVPADAAALHAELTGNLGAIRNRREFLGRLRLLDRTSDRVWATSEAVRLLRQSDSHEALDDAVQWIRAEGPIEVLQQATAAIVDRPRAEPPLNRADLSVVAACADLLSGAQRQTAIKSCLRFLSEPPTGRLSSAETLPAVSAELAWRFIARLLPDSGSDASVARHLMPVAEAPNPHFQLFSRALVQVVEAIDWSVVDERQRARWRAWAMRQTDEERRSISFSVLDEIVGAGRHDPAVGRPRGMELAARLLWENSTDVDSDPVELAAALDACLADVESTRQQAANGQFSFGGYNGAELTVLLATVFEIETAWSAIEGFLRDPAVATSDKGPVLQRLALVESQRGPAPIDLRDAMRALVVQKSGMDPFDEPRMPSQPEALRFFIARRQLSEEELLEFITPLSGGDTTQARVEAARCLSFVGDHYAQASWATGIVLQLSHDADALVRSEAGRALAHVLSQPLRAAAVARVGQLLLSPGVVAPLLTLVGLAETSRPLPSELEDAVERLEVHPSRLVREAAGRLRGT